MKNLVNTLAMNCSGKVGDLVFCNHRTKPYVRRMPKKTDNTPTDMQQARREMFCRVSHLIADIKPLLRSSYGQGTWYQRAMQKILNRAAVFDGRDYTIDFTRIELSEGKLNLPADCGLKRFGIALIASWSVSACKDHWYCGRKDDRAMVLAYDVVAERWLYNTSGETRETQKVFLFLEGSFLENPLEVYLFFVSADNRRASPTRYLGRIEKADDTGDISFHELGHLKLTSDIA